MLINLPLNAEVWCTDGLGGYSTRVIVDPVANRATHLVVQENAVMDIEWLVPVEAIERTTPDAIYLKLSRHELAQTHSFIETGHIVPLPDGVNQATFKSPVGNQVLWPAPPMEPGSITHVREVAPTGKVVVRRGDRVEADGHEVGHIDEFVIESLTGELTHVVVRTGHLWERKVVLVPIEDVAHVAQGVVHLRLSKPQIDALPHVRAH